MKRGFTLLTVLWVVALLGSLAAAAAIIAKEGAGVTRNRIALMRGDWAREACIELLRARAGRPNFRGADTVLLGRRLACWYHEAQPASRLNINLADPQVLVAVIGSDSLADALLDWRDRDTLPRPRGAEQAWYRAHGRPGPADGPLAAVEELSLVRGFEARIDFWNNLLTTRGEGRIDINSAPLLLLERIPGLDGEPARVLAFRRQARGSFASVDEYRQHLSPSVLARPEWAAIEQLLVASPPVTEYVVHGGDPAGSLRASAIVTVSRSVDRAAVLGRITW